MNLINFGQLQTTYYFHYVLFAEKNEVNHNLFVISMFLNIVKAYTWISWWDIFNKGSNTASVIFSVFLIKNLSEKQNNIQYIYHITY